MHLFELFIELVYMSFSDLEVKEVFTLFKRSGHLNQEPYLLIEDVPYALTSLGFRDLDSHEITALTLAMDTQGIGKIDFHNFQRIVNRKNVPSGEHEERLIAFKFFDKNCKGVLSSQDFSKALEYWEVPITSVEFHCLIKYLFNKKRELHYNEWNNFIFS